MRRVEALLNMCMLFPPLPFMATRLGPGFLSCCQE